MDKLQHLRNSKDYLRKINKYRRDLLKFDHGRQANAEMVKTMAEIDYYLGTINSFDRMMNYIVQKGVQERLKKVIPSNKTKWLEELDRLVHQGRVLQGKIVREKQLEINL